MIQRLGPERPGERYFIWRAMLDESDGTRKWTGPACTLYFHGGPGSPWKAFRIKPSVVAFVFISRDWDNTNPKPPPLPTEEEIAKAQPVLPIKRPQPVPRDEWPWIVNWAAALAQPGDTGIGDVVARLTGPVGEWFKATYKVVFGHDCGCERRQAEMNALYPFELER